jgi:hypothetical protein
MGSKNNPKNRGSNEKKKVFNGKEVEPVVFYNVENKQKYLSAKYVKTTDIVCDADGVPMHWKDIRE